MPAEGGESKRLTVHSVADFVVGWMPDGSEFCLFPTEKRVTAQSFIPFPLNGGQPVELGIGAAQTGHLLSGREENGL